MKDYTVPLGFTGGLASLSLGQYNDIIGICVGALTVAYLIRKHRRLSRLNKSEEKE